MHKEIQIRFFLFADVQNFSKLEDDDIGRFVDEFLGGIAAIASSAHGAEIRADLTNTWGDAFLFVFSSAASAGTAALAIRDHVKDSPFFPSGQTVPLGLRIGMHGGPVFAVDDPISSRASLLGSHINRAARIEPITEGGQVFVSLEFAALAAAENVTTFHCVPQGLADLPKAGGRIPVFRLERTTPAPREAQATPR